APSPPREGVTQWTASRIQWWTLAGATARPAMRSTPRSGRSSPMKATCSRSRPRRWRIRSTQATLSFTFTCGSAPSSRARAAATRLSRAVTKATVIPALRSCTRPWPSSTWKALDSRPASSNHSRPSVRVPSTSKQASRTFAARATSPAGYSGRKCGKDTSSSRRAGPPGSQGSDHACPEQVVHVERTDHALRVIEHHQGVDLAGLHQPRGLDRERLAADRDRIAGHHLADGGGVDVHSPVAEGAAQVAVGEQPEQAAVRV